MRCRQRWPFSVVLLLAVLTTTTVAVSEPVARSDSPLPARETSATPGIVDFVRDLEMSPAGDRILWTYHNTGDYDLNGEVNISDLTPIGMYLGQTTASPDWTAAQVTDGDQNGEVNISDITPIGANFKNQIVGFEVWAANVINEEWTQIGDVTVTELQTDAWWPYFSYDISTAGYTLYRVWPYDYSEEEGWWSNIAFEGHNPRLRIVELVLH